MILGLLKPTKGKILINKKDIENHRIELLHKMNFISPYIELPKKLTVRPNLFVYAKLYNVQNINDEENDILMEHFTDSNRQYLFMSINLSSYAYSSSDLFINAATNETNGSSKPVVNNIFGYFSSLILSYGLYE